MPCGLRLFAGAWTSLLLFLTRGRASTSVRVPGRAVRRGRSGVERWRVVGLHCRSPHSVAMRPPVAASSPMSDPACWATKADGVDRNVQEVQCPRAAAPACPPTCAVAHRTACASLRPRVAARSPRFRTHTPDPDGHNPLKHRSVDQGPQGREGGARRWIAPVFHKWFFFETRSGASGPRPRNRSLPTVPIIRRYVQLVGKSRTRRLAW